MAYRLRWLVPIYQMTPPIGHLAFTFYDKMVSLWVAQGYHGACRQKWRLTDTDLFTCGENQTMCQNDEAKMVATVCHILWMTS